MINTEQFLARAECELRSTGAVSAGTCQLWRDLDEPRNASFSRAMAFIAGNDCRCDMAQSVNVTSTDRILASRLMLLKLRVDTSDPRWSSEILGRYVHSVLSTPGGSLNDVLDPLSKLVGESDVELSLPLAHFLKDAVVVAFTEHRSEYEAINWNSFIESLGHRPPQAQCYLAFHAIPMDKLPCSISELIAARLAGTRFQDEVTSALAVSW